MSDIVGRLFPRIRDHADLHHSDFSALVSLTLTPMLSARLLHDPRIAGENPPRPALPNVGERLQRHHQFLRPIRCNLFCASSRSILLIALATLVPDDLSLHRKIPKGLFPIQDTGDHPRRDPRRTRPFPSPPCRSGSRRLAAVILLHDPAVESLSSFIGVDGTNTTLNDGPHPDQPEASGKRACNISASALIILRLQKAVANVPGITLYMQPVQDLTVERSRQPHAVPVYAGGPQCTTELNTWVAAARSIN